MFQKFLDFIGYSFVGFWVCKSAAIVLIGSSNCQRYKLFRLVFWLETTKAVIPVDKFQNRSTTVFAVAALSESASLSKLLMLAYPGFRHCFRAEAYKFESVPGYGLHLQELRHWHQRTVKRNREWWSSCLLRQVESFCCLCLCICVCCLNRDVATLANNSHNHQICFLRLFCFTTCVMEFPFCAIQLAGVFGF